MDAHDWSLLTGHYLSTLDSIFGGLIKESFINKSTQLLALKYGSNIKPCHWAFAMWLWSLTPPLTIWLSHESSCLAKSNQDSQVEESKLGTKFDFEIQILTLVGKGLCRNEIKRFEFGKLIASNFVNKIF